MLLELRIQLMYVRHYSGCGRVCMGRLRSVLAQPSDDPLGDLIQFKNVASKLYVANVA